MKKLMCLMACCFISSASFAFTVVNNMVGIGVIKGQTSGHCMGIGGDWYISSFKVYPGQSVTVPASKIYSGKPSVNCDDIMVNLQVYGNNMSFTANCPILRNSPVFSFSPDAIDHTLTLTGNGQCTWN